MASLYQEARTVCRELGLRPSKRLGQNFLIHEQIIDIIMGYLDLGGTEEVLEIGPGLGFLTRRLVASSKQVWAVEIDRLLAEWLQRSPIGYQPSLTLIQDDILKINLGEILPSHRVKIVANLPYSIATPVLFKIFQERDRFSSVVLMVQEEVADRMAASRGTKTYGTLSVWCQVHGRILARHRVSAEAFFPRPHVRSTILKIGLYPEPLIGSEHFPALRSLLRASFGQRRKVLSNALRKLLGKNGSEVEQLLRQQGIDPRRRGETLSVEEFIRLATSLELGESLKGDTLLDSHH